MIQRQITGNVAHLPHMNNAVRKIFPASVIIPQTERIISTIVAAISQGTTVSLLMCNIVMDGTKDRIIVTNAVGLAMK